MAQPSPSRRAIRTCARSLVAVALALASRVHAEQPPPSSTPPTLVGPVDRAELRKPPFATWFESGYAHYEPKAETLESLRPKLRDASIEVYFGTWCGDSKRQVPRLLRLLDDAAVEASRIRLVGLSDRTGEFKQSPGRPEKARYIHRTPTIVVTRDGREVGRIVETPTTTLEADLEAILDGHPPESKYGAEAYVNRIFTDLPAEKSVKAVAEAEATIRALSRPDTLTHYAEQDLLKNGRALEATALLEVHLRMEPKSVLGHILMAEALAALGRTEESKVWAERALALEPTSSRAARLAGRP